MRKLTIRTQLRFLIVIIAALVSCQKPEGSSESPAGPTTPRSSDHQTNNQLKTRAQALETCLSKASLTQATIAQTFVAGGYYLGQCAHGESLETIHAVVDLYLKTKTPPSQKQLVELLMSRDQ